MRRFLAYALCVLFFASALGAPSIAGSDDGQILAAEAWIDGEQGLRCTLSYDTGPDRTVDVPLPEGTVPRWPNAVVSSTGLCWVVLLDGRTRQPTSVVTSTRDGVEWSALVDIGEGECSMDARDGELFLTMMGTREDGLRFYQLMDGRLCYGRAITELAVTSSAQHLGEELAIYYAAGERQLDGQVTDVSIYRTSFSSRGWSGPEELFAPGVTVNGLHVVDDGTTLEWTVDEVDRSLVYRASIDDKAPTLVDTTSSPPTAGEQPEALATRSPHQWTFAVYIDGDVDLEDAAIDDFLQMSAIGSTAEVNIVCQFDRNPGYDSRYDDWTTCKRYYITDGMVPDVASALEDIGEVNFGDATVAADFFNWTIDNYPADKYMFIFWDHGGGWGGGVCIDSSSGSDRLYDDEIKRALSGAREHLGRAVDVVGFDACLEGDSAVAYACKPHADYLTASEETEGWDGWDYTTILGDLTANPAVSPADIGQYICFTDPSISTISHVDLTAFDYALMPAVNDLAQKLRHVADTQNDNIKSAAGSTQAFTYSYGLDLYDFAANLQASVDDADVQDACQDVMDAFSSTVLYEAHTTSYPDAHGLVVYFDDSYYDTSYDDEWMAMETRWDEFHTAYGASTDYANVEPGVAISNPPDLGTVVQTSVCTIQGTADDSGDGGAISLVEVKIDKDDWHAATGTTSWSYSWDPASVGTGTHYIWARSFDGSDYSAWECHQVDVIKDPNLPDDIIYPSDFGVSDQSPIEGETVNLQATVTNIGTVNASVGTTVGFYWNVIDAEHLIAQVPTDPADIPANDGTGTTAIVPWDTTGFPGDGTVYAVVDPGHDIDELNDSNNVASKPMTIAILDDALLESIDSHEDGSTYYSGTQDITATVRNQGQNSHAVPTRCVILRNESREFLAQDFDHGGAGPSGWTIQNDGTAGGWEPVLESGSDYYMEDDSDAAGSGETQDDKLITPTLDFTGYTSDIYLQFWHYYYYYSGDSGTVQISLDGGGTWPITVDTFTTSDSGVKVYDISSSVADQANVRIRWWYQAGYSWYWRVDDVLVHYQPGTAATEVYNQTDTTGTLSFLGSEQLDWSYDFDRRADYTIRVCTELAGDGDSANDMAEITVTILVPPARDLAIETIDSHADLGTYPTGTQSVLATVSNQGTDPQTGVDVNCKIYRDDVVDTITYFSDDVEGGAGDWAETSTTTSAWEPGAPTNGPAGAHSGSSCWGVDLGVDYVALTEATLTSGTIDLTTATQANLTFWHYGDFEYSTSNYDGGLVEINPGTGWEQITPLGGYDAAISTSYSNPIAGLWAFCHDTSGWEQETFVLDPYCGNSVQIRFRFGSDSSGNAPGWFIDDVNVSFGGGESWVLVHDENRQTTGTMSRYDYQQLTWSYDFDTETDYRITITTYLPDDEYHANDQTSITITIDGMAVPSLDHIAVSPLDPSLWLGDSRLLTATGWNDVGATLENATCAFTWEASGGGTLTPSGGRNLTCEYLSVSEGVWTLWANCSGMTSSITIEVNLSMELDAGLSVISVPYIQGDSSIETVLASIAGCYDAVQWYDASSQTWHHWNSHKNGSGFADTLLYVDHSMALLVNMTSPGTFRPVGTRPAGGENDVTLYPGWNLVGYAGTEDNVLIDDALSGVSFERVERLDAATGAYDALDPFTEVFQKGCGYWIYSSEAGPVLWNVP